MHAFTEYEHTHTEAHINVHTHTHTHTHTHVHNTHTYTHIHNITTIMYFYMTYYKNFCDNCSQEEQIKLLRSETGDSSQQLSFIELQLTDKERSALLSVL